MSRSIRAGKLASWVALGSLGLGFGLVVGAAPAVATPLNPPTPYAINQTAQLGGAPLSVAVDSATGLAYVPNDEAQTISVIKDATGQAVGTIPVMATGYGPIVINPKTDTIYVGTGYAANGTAGIAVVDGTTNSVRSTITLDATYGAEMAVDTATNELFVSGPSGTVNVLSGTTDRVIRTFVVGGYTSAVAVDSATDTVFIANGQSSLIAYDGASGVALFTVQLGAQQVNGLQPLAVDEATDTLWVADDVDGQVLKFNAATGARIGDLPISGAYEIVVDPSTDELAVFSSADKTVSMIDASTLSVTWSDDLSLNLLPPAIPTLAVDSSTGTVFVSSFRGGSLNAINEATGQRLATYYGGAWSFGSAVDPNNGDIYVANDWSGAVSVVDARTMTLLKTIPSPYPRADRVVVDTKTNTIYVATSGNGVYMIDANTNTLIGPALTDVDGRTNGLAINEQTDQIYAAVDGSLVDIDGATKAVVAIPNIDATGGIAVDSETNTIYAVSSGDYAIATGEIEAINGTTNTVTTEVSVGPDASDIAIDEATDRVYVTMATNTSGGSGVTVLSGTTLATLATINPASRDLAPSTTLNAIAVDPRTNTVFLATNSGVAVVDGLTNTVVAQIPYASGPAQGGVDVDSANEKLYVTAAPQDTLSSISIPVTITSAAPAATLTAGKAFSTTVTTASGTSPITFALTAGALPPGIGINATTGVLSGIATRIGTYTYTVTATDANGYASSANYTQTVDPVEDRLSGADRYATSVAVSQSEFPGTASTVYVASGDNFPDALSAGPAAVAANGPVLLSQQASVPASVLAEVHRLHPSSIVLVGGEASLSDAVSAQLQKASTGAKVTRISGADRYQTSVNTVEKSFPHGASTLYVATGAEYPDALSAGAAAGHKGDPLLLIDGTSDTLSTATAAAIRQIDPTNIVVIGGTAAVSAHLAEALGAFGTVTREAGADRYATAEAVDEDTYSSAQRAFVATGANFPDALSATTLAGKTGSPLFLAPTSCVESQTYKDLQNMNTARVTSIGGASSLTAGEESLNLCP
jgi:DNA-binding beta-propeller fold protein YncE